MLDIMASSYLNIYTHFNINYKMAIDEQNINIIKKANF